MRKKGGKNDVIKTLPMIFSYFFSNFFFVMQNRFLCGLPFFCCSSSGLKKRGL